MTADDRALSHAPALAIPAEEEALLARVRASLAERRVPLRGESARSDADLVSLRDEIGEARLEDVAALVAQMERLQNVAHRRAQAHGLLVDPDAPYFGHLRLREIDEHERTREKDVCIGRATYVDFASKVNIVDWRNAPVSQIYYRHSEGSDYEEQLGDREVEGEVLVRRTVTIDGGKLTRVAAPQGLFTRGRDGWEQTEVAEVALAGGEGTATRPGRVRRGVLGSGGPRGQRLDRHLPEIAALIDPRQFELITKPQSGVVVIQGGAGSGKTTIGLHRMAYLAYQAPRRFVPESMLVVTYGTALAAYISEVLPSLGVKGVRVVTFQSWAESELKRAIPWLRVRVDDDSPPVVSRVKSHPAVLRELEARARKLKSRGPGKRGGRAIVDLWAELLTDEARLEELCCRDPEAPLPVREVAEAARLMAERVAALTDREPREKVERTRGGRRGGKRPGPDAELTRQFDAGRSLGAAMRAYADAAGASPRTPEEDDDTEGDETMRGSTGIDGLATAGEEPVLDLGDVAMLLRAHQILRGTRKRLTHLFIDEAQDLSPIELAALINETTDERSVTLAGDTSQRLFLDNGFRDWRTVLHEIGLDHVAVEPLRISYRSTREILQLARFAMGPLADREPPVAPRSGAPVEAHVFPGTGAAVAFLAEALRPLFAREPRATVAILARYPEQADRYYDGLARAEIPSLRRVRVQDFSFRPGIEVTEIRQVKGLEFDYVILVDANDSSFGSDDESRHLFHIAATRAAHQLWLIVTGAPSPLFPPALLG